MLLHRQNFLTEFGAEACAKNAMKTLKLYKTLSICAKIMKKVPVFSCFTLKKFLKTL